MHYVFGILEMKELHLPWSFTSGSLNKRINFGHNNKETNINGIVLVNLSYINT